MRYFKPTSYEIWTALPVERIASLVDDTFSGWNWKVAREMPSQDREGNTVHSIVVRKRRDFQSLQVEILDQLGDPLNLVVVHPRFLHGFNVIPGKPVYALQGPIRKKVEAVVSGLQRLDPDARVAHFRYEGD